VKMSIKLTTKNTVFLHLTVINIFKLMGMGRQLDRLLFIL